MEAIKSTEAYDFYFAAEISVCRFPGCTHSVPHDETARYCRWCQEAYGPSGVLGDDLVELPAGACTERMGCECCGELQICALTAGGWTCIDCR